MLASTRRRFERLEHDLNRLTQSVDKLVLTNRPGSTIYVSSAHPMWAQMLDAAERGRIAMDVAGTRVGYIGSSGGFKTGVVSWHGTVVPCPVDAHIKTHGTTGERFIWVVKDGATWAVGCYPSRLVRV